MDLAFFRRAQAMLVGRQAAALDYRVLVASLEAMQSASSTARAVRAAGASAGPALRHDPLVELLVGAPGWREAVAAQGGCFNPARAAQERSQI
jgi:hypothetical protein